MQQFCPWESAQYFVYSSNIPTLFFYSHIPAIVVAILIGFFVYYKSNKSKIGASLLVVNLLFSLWCIFDLIIWATNRPDIVIFYWSLQILFEPLIYLICSYMVYLFIKERDMPFNWKLLGMLLYSPFIIFLASNYNLWGVDINYCNATEGFIAQYLTYIVELIFILFIVILTIYGYKNINTRKKEIVIFGLGIVLFLIAFSSGNVIGSFTEDWNLAQVGLIGMPVFMGFLAYLIAKFKTFNIKLVAAQILVWGVVILVGSQFFFIKVFINFILTGVTFVASAIFGYLLIKSVKKEIEQKEELAKLNVDLENLLKQRESLVHLVTHKVKGSFTRSKYIFAGILDGTFGDISPEIKKYATQGLESDNAGIQTVDLVLNAANLTKGTVKYELKNIDFKDLVTQSFADKKVGAEAKSLKIDLQIKDGKYDVMGDAFWLKEAVNCLIENSLRYTKAGQVWVSLEKATGSTGENKIKFSVKDTGIGITDEDKAKLFTEGGRGKESVKVNVDSTGYGLYSAKLIIEAHKGKVWGESEGPGKGSQFYIELPATA